MANLNPLRIKVLMLADVNSIHTQRWALALANKGHEILVFGFSPLENQNSLKHQNIQVITSKFNQKFVSRKYAGSLLKASFLFSIFKLKQIVKKFSPQIVHAHFASSYGLLGALLTFKPYIVSVWGSDIFEFPKTSWIHKQIMKFILARSTQILSTSQIMAKECTLYTRKKIIITPFGIDLTKFFPMNKKYDFYEKEDIVIGTIKTLEEKYGISYLIKAFAFLNKNVQSERVKLMIVGSGNDEQAYKKLVKELNLVNKVNFVPKIPHNEVPKYLAETDIFVALSTQESESFGVAIIEASACEKPVIVSKVGGLPEVVKDNITGIIVPNKDCHAAAKAMETLILDPKKRTAMGKAGRERVKSLYDWDKNVTLMENIYNSTLLINK